MSIMKAAFFLDFCHNYEDKILDFLKLKCVMTEAFVSQIPLLQMQQVNSDLWKVYTTINVLVFKMLYHIISYCNR